MRPWLEEALQQKPRTLQEVYNDRLKLIKSHPVPFRFKNVLYLFLSAVEVGDRHYCLVLRLQERKIVGIDVINPETNERQPAQGIDLSQARWDGGVHFSFGHIAEVLEHLGVNLHDHTQVYSTLLLLRPAMLNELWLLRTLMKEEWSRHPEISVALSAQFVWQCMQDEGDILDLLAQFMVAYIVTEE